MLTLAEVADKIVQPSGVAVASTVFAALGLTLSLRVSRWFVVLLVAGAVVATVLALSDYRDGGAFTNAVVREVGSRRIVHLALAANVPFLLALAFATFKREARAALAVRKDDSVI